MSRSWKRRASDPNASTFFGRALVTYLRFAAGAALLFRATGVGAQGPGEAGYTGPTLEIPIPNVNFSGIVRENSYITIPWLSQYIGGVYTFLISIVGVVAAVAMIVGGFQYLTAGGDKNRLGEGRKKILNALTGLVLALGSYTILYVINPDLVEFDGLKVLGVTTEKYPFETGIPEGLVEQASGTVSAPPNIRSGKLARFCDWAPGMPEKKGTTDCSPICRDWGCGTAISDDNCGATFPKMPLEATGAINPNSSELIPSSKWPSMTNIKTRSKSVKATQAVIDGLKRTDAYLSANYAGQGYSIQVNNCWRDWRGDAAKECGIVLGDHIQYRGGPVDRNPNNYALAWPGVGPHSSGAACDMILFKNGKQISGINGGQQNCNSMKAGNELFVDMLTNATVGAKRLNFEAWHFEWGGPDGCRCIGQTCKDIWRIKIPQCSSAGGSGSDC